jgi:pimeloyl-ACP methyl ester carboxylesterase
MMKTPLLRACLAFGLVLSMPAAFAQQGFSFVALGDLPYGSPEKAYGPYRALIDRINQVRPDFSIHVGDIKSGSTLCSDEEFANQLEHFQRFKGAVVFTPGDNEWTDCHRANNGAYDPLERLAALRKGFFKPGQSLGSQPIRVQSQAQRTPTFATYVENLRWQHQGVQFNTVHIVGSNNNLEARDAAASKEFYERDSANVAWIQSAFADAAAQNPSLIVFAFQADVLDSKSMYEDFPGWSGFRQSIGETLLPLAQRWGKPVLVIHGDSHKFKLDQPFTLNRQPLPNITRLIVPGASDVRAVKVTVQPGAALAFELISPAP